MAERQFATFKRDGGGGSLLIIRSITSTWIAAISVAVACGLFAAGTTHADIMPEAFAQVMSTPTITSTSGASGLGFTSDDPCIWISISFDRPVTGFGGNAMIPSLGPPSPLISPRNFQCSGSGSVHIYVLPCIDRTTRHRIIRRYQCTLAGRQHLPTMQPLRLSCIMAARSLLTGRPPWRCATWETTGWDAMTPATTNANRCSAQNGALSVRHHFSRPGL